MRWRNNQVALDEAMVISRERDAEIVALDEALNGLAQFAPRKWQVVELRFLADWV